MQILASKVHSDEPCYGLAEIPENGRWLQKIFVIRDDCIAKYQVDLGPESDFEKVMPLVMPSYGDDTVGQLMAYADKNRQDHYWYNRRQEMLGESTLIEDHLRLLDNGTRQLFNQSVFGPAISVQRNRTNRQAMTRHLKERLNGN